MNNIIKHEYEIIEDSYESAQSFFILKKIFIFNLYFAGQIYGINGDCNNPFKTITAARKYLRILTPPKRIRKNK